VILDHLFYAEDFTFCQLMQHREGIGDVIAVFAPVEQKCMQKKRYAENENAAEEHPTSKRPLVRHNRMVAKEILSVQHPLIKRAVALREKRKMREQERMVLIMGKKLISDLVQDLFFDVFFYRDVPPPFAVREQIRVSDLVLRKITGLEESDGWAAIVSLPTPRSIHECERILILDRIVDPGNFGTLWRTAWGLGWQGIWLTSGTVDPFNDKAMRAAQGATFRMPYEWMKPERILAWAHQREAALLVADLEGEPLDTFVCKKPFALILSHETQGPDDWTNSCTKVTIPMTHGVESLNVASAGSIFLYVLKTI
jgi:RNA methyltransferase, TrmH family